jgi:hypothetical protein
MAPDNVRKDVRVSIVVYRATTIYLIRLLYTSTVDSIRLSVSKESIRK